MPSGRKRVWLAHGRLAARFRSRVSALGAHLARGVVFSSWR